MIYRVGQVWERDGKRREIVAVEGKLTGAYYPNTDGMKPHGYTIEWRRDIMERCHRCWGPTWKCWARSAELVGGLVR